MPRHPTLAGLAGAILALACACSPPPLALPPAAPTPELVVAPVLATPAPVLAPAPAPPLSAEELLCQRGTGRLLASLREPVDVTAWLVTGTPQLDAFGRAIEELLARYERLAPGKLSSRVIRNPSARQRAEAKDAGLQEMAFGEAGEGGETATIQRGFMGMVFKYRHEKEVIPLMSAGEQQGLEFWIMNKIREVRDRADDVRIRIGVIAGKDEIKLSEANLIAATAGRAGPSLKGIMEQALPFYRFEDVELRGGAAEIDKDLVGLVITQPGKDYTEKELRRIDQFLTRGNKAAAIFASAVNVEAGDASMKAKLNLHGLDRLLEGYGVEMKKDAVFDWERPAVLRVTAQGQQLAVGHPATALAQFDRRAGESTQSLDPSFPGFFRMEEVVFPFPSTLVAHPDRQPRARVKVVARTTPRATAVTAATVVMKPASGALQPQGDYGQRAVAVAIEGELQSAFGGPAQGKARLVVISAAQFLANPYARAGNPRPAPPRLGAPVAFKGDEELMILSQPYAQQYLTGMILVFKNTLDWMANDEDLIDCAALLVRKPGGRE